MGILDFLKRGKNKEDNMTRNDSQEAPAQQSLSLQYHSGKSADVVFADNVEIDGKTLKKAVIWDWPEVEDEVAMGKEVLLEPHTKVVDGKEVDSTYEYYYNLMQNGKTGAVKGFFQLEQVNKRPTNYLGALDFDSDGKPIRWEDTAFVEKYKEIYERARKEKEKGNFAKELAKNNKTEAEMAYEVGEDEEPTYYGPNDIRSKMNGYNKEI